MAEIKRFGVMSFSVNLVSIVIITGAGGLSFLAGIGLMEAIDTIPEPRALILERLEFKSGKFVQRHVVTGEKPIRARWAAEIMRGDTHLCSGGGTSVYTSGINGFTPNEWTGATCPPIKVGDIGRAVWEYTSPRGYVVSITGEVVIGVLEKNNQINE